MKLSRGFSAIILFFAISAFLLISALIILKYVKTPLTTQRLTLFEAGEDPGINKSNIKDTITSETPQNGIEEITKSGQRVYPRSGESFRMPKPPEPENDSPTVRVINYHDDEEELNKTYPIYLSIEAKDKVGGIKEVEFYVNGVKKATIQKRDMHLNITSGYDSDDADEITERAVGYVKDKYNEEDLLYIHRTYFQSDGTPFDCDVTEGYLIILAGKDNFYDTRVSQSTNTVDVCYKDRDFNYNDYYNYMFYGDDGDYEYYAIAYDINGKSTKSMTKSFSVD